MIPELLIQDLEILDQASKDSAKPWNLCDSGKYICSHLI